MSERLEISSPAQMVQLGQALAGALKAAADRRLVIGVQGELGAGKTTLIRAILRGLGVRETIPSPTYTLIEPYSVGGQEIFHLDLYRLQGAQELDFLGLDDVLETADLVLIEWPERAPALLQATDLAIEIAYLERGRSVMLTPRSDTVADLLDRLGTEDLA